MSKEVIYTGHFVKNQDEVLSKLPPAISSEGRSIYAHHVTKEFMPVDGKGGIEPGRERILRIIGHVVTAEVHVAIVESPDGDKISNNEFAHLTIATAKDVPPVKSNEVIAKAKREGTIRAIEPPIELKTVEGYFDGEQVHIQ